jgi:uncharacterized membrane protein YraQ (UPF0718 family)
MDWWQDPHTLVLQVYAGLIAAVVSGLIVRLLIGLECTATPRPVLYASKSTRAFFAVEVFLEIFFCVVGWLGQQPRGSGYPQIGETMAVLFIASWAVNLVGALIGHKRIQYLALEARLRQRPIVMGWAARLRYPNTVTIPRSLAEKYAFRAGCSRLGVA